MGIFDNVNWQQMLPVAMSALAGGMDPNHSQQLGQSGWNAVQNYMMQQRMQQEQQQQQERRKMQQQEMDQRDKTLQMQQKRFDVEQKERTDEDFIFQNMGALSDISDEAGLSEYQTRINTVAKEKGYGPVSASTIAKVAKQWEFLPTPTGEVGFGLQSDGSLWTMEKAKQKGGAKWVPTKVASSITPDMIKTLKESPELALKFADSLKKNGNTEAAAGVSAMANRILQEKEAKDLGGTRIIMSKLEQDHKTAIATFESTYGKKDTVTGNYPGAPEDPEKAKAYNAQVDAARQNIDEMYYQGMNAVVGGILSTPSGRKEAEKQIKTVNKPFAGTEDQMALYKTYLSALKDNPKLTREQKIAAARAATLHVSENPVPGKKPVSVSKKQAAAAAAAPAVAPAPAPVRPTMTGPRPEYPGQYMPQPGPGSAAGYPAFGMGQDEMLYNQMRRMSPRRY